MLQFISVDLVRNGSDPIYILSKNATVQIQTEKAFHIESSTINLLQYFSDLSNLDDHGSLSDLSRVGLTIGQTGQMTRASQFWGALCLNVKTFLYWFFMFLGLFTTRQTCRAFWLLRLISTVG